jgi:cell wall-associated NlpC family hydrolase
MFIFSIFFTGCKTSKSGIITSKEKAKEKGIYAYNEKNTHSSRNNKKGKSQKIKVNIVDTAKEYLGVKYKSSGTTKAGMDCSGLVYTSFLAYDIELSRISSDMAKEGREITPSKAEEGDLIFFKTNNSKTINHVGIITENNRDEIKFIHSSTSKGVIISSLNESYYAKAFEKIKRIIE